MKMFLALMISYYFLSFALPTLAEQCGWQGGGATCPGGVCCNQWGWCGTTGEYCADGCQSNCRNQLDGVDDVSQLISKQMFEKMLLHRNDSPNCAIGFYTYEAFIIAAKFFPSFGNTGTVETRKRELAAFFGQTSHETTGGWEGAPDGPYAWGYCFNEQIVKCICCVPSTQWPCVPGKKYYGRGPIQITYNYNYGPAGKAIGYNLTKDPELVANDTVISFKTAIWFWMTPQSPKPSCHQVMTNQWKPSQADIKARRYPGYGVVTNIINGGLECGNGSNRYVKDRIGFYRRYADMLGVSYGDNLDCYNQRPFGSALNEYVLNKNSGLSDI